MVTPAPHQRTISVIMPAFNAEDTIGASITGVLTQTYPHVELIVIDDGSTDRTRAICEAYGDRLTYLRQDNGGSATARNTGIKAATGDYIAFCDSDDVLLPQYLDRCMEALTLAGGGRRFVCSEGMLLTESGVHSSRRLLVFGTPAEERQRFQILTGNFISVCALAPRAMLDELDGFDTTLRYREDWDLWIRALFSGWRVCYQRDPQVLYRWTPNAKSTHTVGYDCETELLRRAAERYHDILTTEEREYLTRRLNVESPRLMVVRAEEALRLGDTTTARNLYLRASSLSPFDRKLAVKAQSMQVPLLANLWRKRLDSVDSQIGRTSGAGR